MLPLDYQGSRPKKVETFEYDSVRRRLSIANGATLPPFCVECAATTDLTEMRYTSGMPEIEFTYFLCRQHRTRIRRYRTLVTMLVVVGALVSTAAMVLMFADKWRWITLGLGGASGVITLMLAGLIREATAFRVEGGRYGVSEVFGAAGIDWYFLMQSSEH